MKLQGFDGAATRVTFTATADRSVGDVVEIGGHLGVVCYQDVASGEEGLAYVATDENGILMPKAAVAPAKSATAYWDSGNGVVTNTDNTGANPQIGFFAKAAAAGDAEVAVELTNEPIA